MFLLWIESIQKSTVESVLGSSMLHIDHLVLQSTWTNYWKSNRSIVVCDQVWLFLSFPRHDLHPATIWSSFFSRLFWHCAKTQVFRLTGNQYTVLEKGSRGVCETLLRYHTAYSLFHSNIISEYMAKRKPFVVCRYLWKDRSKSVSHARTQRHDSTGIFRQQSYKRWLSIDITFWFANKTTERLIMIWFDFIVSFLVEVNRAQNTCRHGGFVLTSSL